MEATALTPGTETLASTPPDADEIRGQFPILAREQDGRLLAYLDNGATSQKPLAVIEALDRYWREQNANVHRGVYRLSEEATEMYEHARRVVAARLGGDRREVVFVRNATEALNLIAYSWGRKNISEGDRILLTEMEHHSNIVPWYQLASEKGAELDWIPVDAEGRLDLTEYERLLERRPKLVGVAHVSNVLGTINPIRTITRMAHDAGALVVVDGAQAGPKLPLDMAAIGADFYALTSHKMYGPTGIGALYGRRELAHAHEARLTAYALERLGEVPGLRIFGPAPGEDRAGIISFELEGVHGHDVAEILDRHAVCVRAGHHCAQVLMDRLGVAATTRASLAVYNTREEIDRLVEALADVRRIFELD